MKTAPTPHLVPVTSKRLNIVIAIHTEWRYCEYSQGDVCTLTIPNYTMSVDAIVRLLRDKGIEYTIFGDSIMMTNGGDQHVQSHRGWPHTIAQALCIAYVKLFVEKSY